MSQINNNEINKSKDVVTVDSSVSDMSAKVIDDKLAPIRMPITPSPDPNVIGTGSEQNLDRDIELEVVDKASAHVRVLGQNYGRPPDKILLLQDYFKKPVLIGTYSWTTATAVQTLAPYALWEALAVVNSKFGYYNKRSYNLKVSLSLAASPYHIGAAIVDWNPCDRGSATDALGGSFIGSQRRHVVLTADNSYFELAIPHYDSTPYEIGSTAAGANKGTLAFKPLAALSRCDGTAPGTIVVTVRAWTEDMAMYEPSFIQTMMHKGNSYDSSATEDVNTLANGAAAFTRLAGRVGQRVESVMAKLGLTVKSDSSAHAMIPRSVGSFAVVDGTRQIDTLTAYDTNYITPMEDGSNLGDQLTIGSITSRRGMIIASTVYNTTLATGDIIMNIPVNPMLTNVATTYGVTPLGYVSNLFNYWVGSIAFTVTVYSSPLQQGAILIAHEPCSTAPAAGNNSQAAATAKACVIDLATSKKKTLLVSSANGTNELLITRNTANSVTAPSVRWLSASGTAVTGASAGYLTISVNKPLIAPGASNVIITVEVAAGPDFQLFDYNPEFIDMFTQTMLAIVPPTGNIEEQTCDLRLKVFDDVRKAHAGEEIVSLRALLNRPHFVQYAPLSAKSTVTPVAATLYPNLNVNRILTFSNFKNEASSVIVQARVPVTDLVNYVSGMFARRTGGMRYTIATSYRVTDSSPQYISLYRGDGGMPTTNSFYNGGFYGTANTNLGQSYPWTTTQCWGSLVTQGCGNVIQDMRSNPISTIEDTPVSVSPYLSDNSQIGIWLFMRNAYATDTCFLVYRSAKPDLNFYEFVGVPVLSTASRTAANLVLTTTSDNGSIV